jgi:hypothetical protein
MHLIFFLWVMPYFVTTIISPILLLKWSDKFLSLHFLEKRARSLTSQQINNKTGKLMENGIQGNKVCLPQEVSKIMAGY